MEPDQVIIKPYYGEIQAGTPQSFKIDNRVFEEMIKHDEPISYKKNVESDSPAYHLLKSNFDFDELIGYRVYNKEGSVRESSITFIYMHTSLSPVGNLALNHELLMIMTQWIGQVYQSRKANAEQLSSEMRYRMVIESANDAIILADENLIIQSWNPAARKTFQFTSEEALGSKVDIIIPEKFLNKHRNGSERFRQSQNGKIIGTTVELEGKRKDGSCFPIELSLYTWDNDKGRFYGCMIRDITERKRDRDMINDLAYNDALTGLLNRTSFEENMDRLFEKSQAFILLFIDIDGFKEVNDTYGHTTGDLLLQTIAERLHNALQFSGMVPYRYGGDEFLVVIENHEAAGVLNIKEEIIKSLSRPYYLKGDAIHISASIGEGAYPTDGDDLNKLLKAADDYMYQMKQRGGGRAFLKEKVHDARQSFCKWMKKRLISGAFFVVVCIRQNSGRDRHRVLNNPKS